MYILIHSCDICKIYYLLLMLYYALVLFWVGDYPLSMWLFNPSIYIFSPRCDYYWWPAVLYFNIQFIKIVYM